MKILNQYPWLLSAILTLTGWVWVMAGERAVTQQKLDNLDTRIMTVQQRNQMLSDKLVAIHNSVTQVKTDVRWLRESWANKRQQESLIHD
ncbi:hypothetical protein JYU15_01430 [bacterium AH-315-I18]|nr:hypothetical protein [Phycisphaeraceae bacterium]MBN4061075.1 hypothetical protein [bacterium AH-315-I18]